MAEPLAATPEPTFAGASLNTAFSARTKTGEKVFFTRQNQDQMLTDIPGEKLLELHRVGAITLTSNDGVPVPRNLPVDETGIQGRALSQPPGVMQPTFTTPTLPQE